MSSDQAGECTITLEDGTHYDLSSLASAKADYQTTGGNSTFNLNVCRGVVGEVWNVDNPETVGGYFNKEAGDFSLG
jgi:cation-dependent mannose-6-phosphate receptor